MLENRKNSKPACLGGLGQGKMLDAKRGDESHLPKRSEGVHAVLARSLELGMRPLSSLTLVS
jgi:hypothetical protein